MSVVILSFYFWMFDLANLFLSDGWLSQRLFLRRILGDLVQSLETLTTLPT